MLIERAQGYSRLRRALSEFAEPQARARKCKNASRPTLPILFIALVQFGVFQAACHAGPIMAGPTTDQPLVFFQEISHDAIVMTTGHAVTFGGNGTPALPGHWQLDLEIGETEKPAIADPQSGFRSDKLTVGGVLQHHVPPPDPPHGEGVGPFLLFDFGLLNPIDAATLNVGMNTLFALALEDHNRTTMHIDVLVATLIVDVSQPMAGIREIDGFELTVSAEHKDAPLLAVPEPSIILLLGLGLLVLVVLRFKDRDSTLRCPAHSG